MYWLLKMLQRSPCFPSFLSLLSLFSSFCPSLPSVLWGEMKAAASLLLSSHPCFLPPSSLCLHVVVSLCVEELAAALLFPPLEFCFSSGFFFLLFSFLSVRSGFKVQSGVFYCIPQCSSSSFSSLFFLCRTVWWHWKLSPLLPFILGSVTRSLYIPNRPSSVFLIFLSKTVW